MNASVSALLKTGGSFLNLHTENSQQSWEQHLQTAQSSFFQHPAKTNMIQLKMNKTRHMDTPFTYGAHC